MAKRRMNPTAAVDADRFWTYVIDRPADGCWTFKKKPQNSGYCQYGQPVDGKEVRWVAHRVAYELLVGPIPEGLTLDHLCRNRACCNPEHLEPVTNAENVRRGATCRSSPFYNRPRAACGTVAGYAAHHYRDEKACSSCLKAWTTYGRAWYAKYGRRKAA